MESYTEPIREIAARLLKDCQVEAVIGFRKGSVPMMNEPCIITRADDAGQLVWDGNCGINLANYLTGRSGKIGVFAKGCDSRNIVTHILENKVQRDRLVIVGVPCTGMIDKRRIRETAPGEITEVVEDANNIRVRGRDFEEVYNRKEMLQRNCRHCAHPNPVIHDELVADLLDGADRRGPVRGGPGDRGHGPGGKAALLFGFARALHPVLRLPERLPALLLPHLFRG